MSDRARRGRARRRERRDVRRSRIDLLGLSVLGVWLWALLASSGLPRMLHFALVPHVPCEHGELVHGPHAHASHVHGAGPTGTRLATDREALSAPARDQASRDEQVASTGLAAIGSHLHCDLFATVSDVATNETPRVAPTLLAWELDQGGLVGSVETSPIALLLLAPKSSPPLG